MFSNKQQDKTMASSSAANANGQSINMISEGTTIKGAITASHDIRIAGTIDGQAQSEGRLVLTSKGRVTGNVVAHDGDIAGSVDGELHVSGTLVLRKTAKVRGDIHTKSLVIEEGATFNGACKMSANPLEGVESIKRISRQEEKAAKTQSA